MSQDTSPFTRRLASNARAVEALLERLLGTTTEVDEIARPANLLAAMRHGVLNGGKRLRPFLVIECADLLGGSIDASLRVGAALECVHCYSLVHDDLPAMDDDDVRRGQPTVHRAFDEATAILAGDSLLTFAFDIIAAPETPLTDAQKVELILALGRAAGHGGMAGGEVRVTLTGDVYEVPPPTPRGTGPGGYVAPAGGRPGQPGPQARGGARPRYGVPPAETAEKSGGMPIWNMPRFPCQRAVT